MATSAVIHVENGTIALYKHYDGSPESTLPWLMRFNEEFTATGRKDISSKEAQLVRSSAFMADEFRLSKDTEIGWGIIPFEQNNIGNYNYRLNADGTVDVQGSRGGWTPATSAMFLVPEIVEQLNKSKLWDLSD